MKAGRTILFAWSGLLALLVLTVAASFAPLGHALPYISYGIAFAKTAIVAWIFMELRARDGLQRRAHAAGVGGRALLRGRRFADHQTPRGPP